MGTRCLLSGSALARVAMMAGSRLARFGILVFVQRLQQAAFDLRLGKHGTGHHDVVAGIARHQLGVQGLVGFKGVVVDLDAGFFFEGGDHALGHVVGPVVDIEHFFFGVDRRRLAGAAGGTGRWSAATGAGSSFLPQAASRIAEMRQDQNVFLHGEEHSENRMKR